MATGIANAKLWLRRFGWLVLIWSASVAALGIAAFAFRPAQLTCFGTRKWILPAAAFTS